MTQWKAFVGVCAMTAIVLMMRLSVLLPLYADAEVRSDVSRVVAEVSEERGWLQSGISILKIQDDSVQLQYRSYHRGVDEVECVVVQFADSSSAVCES